MAMQAIRKTDEGFGVFQGGKSVSPTNLTLEEVNIFVENKAKFDKIMNKKASVKDAIDVEALTASITAEIRKEYAELLEASASDNEGLRSELANITKELLEVREMLVDVTKKKNALAEKLKGKK